MNASPSRIIQTSAPAIEDWLRSIHSEDANTEQKFPVGPPKNWPFAQGWHDIGKEVLARKTLLLAASKDLLDSGVVSTTSAALKLSAADIFVEKAQARLTFRGVSFYVAGAVCALLTVTVLAIFGCVLHNNLSNLSVGDFNESEGKISAFLTIYILKATALGACAFGAVYFFGSLTRAFFHEATTIFNRRHSLRFARFCMYLTSREELKLADLQGLFLWDTQSSTAFRDINAENIAKSPSAHTLALAHEILKVATERDKAGKEKE